MLVIGTETRKWREEFLSRKRMWLDQDVAFKKTTGYKNTAEMKNMATCLLRVKGSGRTKLKKR
jgi:hypothetical protein